MKIDFKHIALLSASICIALALIWLLTPKLLLSLWAVEFSEPVGLVSRRASPLFAGMGLMLFKLRHVGPSPARTAVSSGLMVTCLMLALLGIIELVIGHAGTGILLAVTVEIALALGFYLAS